MLNRFAGKKVLVTGAAGFLGSHLVETMLEEGAMVMGIDNFITGNADNLSEVESENLRFIEADVTQPAGNYLQGEVFDYIFHFASPASPPFYQKYPRETYLVNTVATDALLQYLQATNPEGTFIFAGTSEAYGDPLEHPQKETYWGNVNPNGIRSCYDESKRLGETICGVFNRDFEIDTRIVRIFNTYGPRIGAEDGRVIPSFINSALHKRPMTIFGSGSQTRSYCYVSDLVEGILRLSLEPRAKGETVNIGNPEEYTVSQTANIIWREVYEESSEPMIEHKDLPGDDPTRRKPDISKAKELLDWEPTVSFEEGLKKTVEWFSR
ncbi:MAG: NAD-dependent epimerase/dehydratase family protein [Candidatus Pacebacteria bacterium]|jgi:nucleoside-diphosphate-sugar epimerase|nr:NAD-dependent epimerase/dehydratase family protein [Candidatus Paceibacterota bacterium]MBT4652055.1 NAD-dependent epimerase/dehydratase family protein [Candidatus Paceibacterota bacterium]MBT6756077.1 NAD-dependent epimerase/dehydratase family protein [Candidatus Paceibacterota bacterium]MBT6921670.1 NAD-dependent epimerase/dehydratase family protein [Candidatus Paceibacterota bacterium]